MTTDWERAARLAAARHRGFIDRDEAEQVALIAAWQASLRWTPDGGASLSTWCYRKARWALLSEMQQTVPSYPLTIEPPVEDELPDVDPRCSELVDIVEHAARTLQDRAICHLLAQGHRPKVIADTLGISQVSFSQRVARMRQRLAA